MFKTQIAYDNWVKKYKYQNETPLQSFERVARALANVEKEEVREYWYEKFLNIIVKFDEFQNPIGLKCLPGGRINANAGTAFGKATLMNCFISGPVSNATIQYRRKAKNLEYPVTIKTDESPDDLLNIFLTVLEQAKTLAAEGGYGINFSFIRPRGTLIKGTGVKHPGVVSYMEIWDSVSECIVKGTDDGYVDKIKNYLTTSEIEDVKSIIKAQTRKGAMLSALDCSHPDLEEYIRAKQVPGKLTKFNISVVLDDEFMRCVENDDFYNQSFNGKVIKKVKARELYNLIMESTYNRGEPGVLFVDNMHRNNPIAYLGKANCTNPCVVGSTIIAVADGPCTIEELAEIGEDVDVYSMNVLTKQIEVKLGRNPRKTGEKKEVWKLTLDDDSIFIATNDHKMILEDGTEIRLEDLQKDDCLMSPTKVKVKSVEFYGFEDVYNITVDDNHNYLVCNSEKMICVKNCGEVPGLPSITSVCLLGSLNLTQYVFIRNGEAFFEFKQYEEDIVTFTRMLDNVNDISNNPLPSYDWVTKNLRQIGMGINGLGSTLLMLGIPYNSKEATDFTKKVCQTKENVTIKTSALLAKEKGTFSVFDMDQYTKTDYFMSDRITEETKEIVRKYGMRNAKTTTNPPLGNGSVVCDNVSNGIEPIFTLEYDRKMICEWPEGLNADNVKDVLAYNKKKDFEYWQGDYKGISYYYEPHNRGLCKVTKIRDYGYQWYLDHKSELNDRTNDFMITTDTLKVDDHLNIQEIVQYYNNQSVSKTSNLPNDYPFEDFSELYLKAWKKGLNGFTTYRDGSMESVLSKVEESRELIKKDIKLPEEFLNGPTTIIKREGSKFYLHFSYLPDDTNMKFPVCLWIHTNSNEKSVSVVCNKAARELAKLALKCGIPKNIIEEAIEKTKFDYPHNRLGRMISLCLRHNISRLDVLSTLEGIEGDNISTLLTAVRKFLSKTIKDGTKLSGFVCPECKSSNIVMESGCKKCADCQWTLCS
jgi:ribonucleotide reductase alpha subunit